MTDESNRQSTNIDTGEGSQGSHPQSCSARSLMADWTSPLHRSVCQITIRKACYWTI